MGSETQAARVAAVCESQEPWGSGAAQHAVKRARLPRGRLSLVPFLGDVRMSERTACLLCGASLARHRAGARYCSSACQVEAWRGRRLLAGAPAGRYSELAVRDRAEDMAPHPWG
jgi:hypothetical protein